MEDETKLTLKDVKVVFFNPEDTGFGTSITIDCTDEAVEKEIKEWVKNNNIGKDTPGVAKIKEYTNPETGVTTHQFNFRINEHTQYAGMNGLGKDDLAYGAVIDLIARAFTYNNKFTGGKDRVGQSVSAIVVKSAGASGGGADLAELLGSLGDAPTETTEAEGVPF